VAHTALPELGCYDVDCLDLLKSVSIITGIHVLNPQELSCATRTNAIRGNVVHAKQVGRDALLERWEVPEHGERLSRLENPSAHQVPNVYVHAIFDTALPVEVGFTSTSKSSHGSSLRNGGKWARPPFFSKSLRITPSPSSGIVVPF